MSNPKSAKGFNEALKVGEDNIPMHRSEITERLKVMKKQECTIYHIRDYLNLEGSPSDSQTHIDALCRYRMAKWCYTLVDALCLDRKTVSIAMSYLDRFIASGSPRAGRVLKNRSEYQLASMTALYMAIKVFEPKIMDPRQFADLSQGKYKSSDIIDMESDILFNLKWRLNGPTAAAFLVYFTALLPPLEQCGNTTSYDAIVANATYQIELSVTKYSFVTEHPSTIAVAALMSSIERLAASDSDLISKMARMLNAVDLATDIDVLSSNVNKIAKRLDRLQNELSPIFQKRSNNYDDLTVKEDKSIHHDFKSSTNTQRSRAEVSPMTCV